tara:strand:- start:2372 stop:2551 length:180 start_codon:yes stop_codon:yes gene_type:complete
MASKKLARYSTVAIKPELHKKLKILATHNYQTIGGYLESLVDKEIKKLEATNDLSKLQR